MKLRSFIGAGLSLLPLVNSASAGTFFAVDPISGCKVVLDSPVKEGELLRWIGPCKDGFASGHGALQWVDDGVLMGSYEGQMARGKIEGEGALHFFEDGGYTRMIGSFKDGALDGEGTIAYANGDLMSGSFLDGELNGSGRFLASNGSSYVGTFKAGIPHGFGESVAADGEAYSGGCEEGERHGAGDGARC